jgi:hypothetical protein
MTSILITWSNATITSAVLGKNMTVLAKPTAIYPIRMRMKWIRNLTCMWTRGIWWDSGADSIYV